MADYRLPIADSVGETPTGATGTVAVPEGLRCDLFSFILSLTAGPEELRRLRKRSRKRVVDIPNRVCYLSCRNGNRECTGNPPNAECGRCGRPVGALHGARPDCELGRVRAASAGLQFNLESRHWRHFPPRISYMTKKARPVSGVVEWGNLRVCSRMVAYVRLMGEKMLRALRRVGTAFGLRRFRWHFYI